MRRILALLSLLVLPSCAKATPIFKGRTHSLVKTSQNLQILQGNKVVFDAKAQGQKLLKASTCKTLSYRVMPLSKIESTFSYLEEGYFEGGDCGVRGYSYQLNIRAINLRTGKDATIFQHAPQKIIESQLLQDSYLKKIMVSKTWQPRNLDNTFFEWNTTHCDSTVTNLMFNQFYVFDARTQPAKIRLALPFVCPAPLDNVTAPKQLGLLVKVNFNKADDFDFVTIKQAVGEGVRLNLRN